MAKKILIIEDDLDIQEMIQFFLEDQKYKVVVAGDGVEGISVFNSEKPDLVLLDILLPKMDGYAVCELIRKESEVPIIMISALGSEEDQIKGFDLQIDDYIPKPISLPLMINIKGKVVDLTQKEYEILKELMERPGIVISRESFLNRLWKYDFYGDERAVDNHIKNLRRKLGDAGNYIETVRGV